MVKVEEPLILCWDNLYVSLISLSVTPHAVTKTCSQTSTLIPENFSDPCRSCWKAKNFPNFITTQLSSKTEGLYKKGPRRTRMSTFPGRVSKSKEYKIENKYTESSDCKRQPSQSRLISFEMLILYIHSWRSIYLQVFSQELIVATFISHNTLFKEY